MKKSDLLTQFSEQLLPAKENDFHIALSGGLDSVVLLHLFARLREIAPQLAISAQHIDHGLSENAQYWSDFCAALCAKLEIDFTCTKVDLQRQSRTSLEALAREKRYASLQQTLSPTSVLVTAHHQDDQLETLLLALKRGSGSTGLQGIKRRQKLNLGYLLRPLLTFSRAQLESYAALFKLTWIEDESNADQLFDRNFIRHTITPLLKTRWPGIAKSVARSAAICQEQQQILDEIAAQDFSLVVCYFLNQQALNFVQLKEFSVGRRNNVLRFWFKENRFDYPSAAQLQAIWLDLVQAKNDALPIMQFKGYCVRRYRDCIYLLSDQTIAPNLCESTTWQGEQRIDLADGRVPLLFNYIEKQDETVNALSLNTLSLNTLNLNTLNLNTLNLNTLNLNVLSCQKNSTIEICFRQHLPAKLCCQPLGRAGSRSIKKLLHEYHVPPWLRSLIPFILIDGELRAALGLWQCGSRTSAEQSCSLAVSLA